MPDDAVDWFHCGIIVRGSRDAIEDFIKKIQADFGLVILARHVSSSRLKVVEVDLR